MKRNRNKRSTGRTVLGQFLKDVKTEVNYSGERSPYWDWSRKNTLSPDDAEINEMSRANPDVLMSSSDDYSERREAQQEKIKDVYLSLSLQEKRVFYFLRLAKTEKEIAKEMAISIKTVNGYRRRIVNKFKAYDSKQTFNDSYM